MSEDNSLKLTIAITLILYTVTKFFDLYKLNRKTDNEYQTFKHKNSSKLDNFIWIMILFDLLVYFAVYYYTQNIIFLCFLIIMMLVDYFIVGKRDKNIVKLSKKEIIIRIFYDYHINIITT
jgi:hypothetical protein